MRRLTAYGTKGMNSAGDVAGQSNIIIFETTGVDQEVFDARWGKFQSP